MRIFVCTLTNRNIEIECEPTSTIEFVKIAIEHKEKVATSQMRLIHGGRELKEDKHTLAQYNVNAGDSIHMVLQLRGGSLN